MKRKRKSSPCRVSPIISSGYKYLGLYYKKNSKPLKYCYSDNISFTVLKINFYYGMGMSCRQEVCFQCLLISCSRLKRMMRIILMKIMLVDKDENGRSESYQRKLSEMGQKFVLLIQGE